MDADDVVPMATTGIYDDVIPHVVAPRKHKGKKSSSSSKEGFDSLERRKKGKDLFPAHVEGLDEHHVTGAAAGVGGGGGATDGMMMMEMLEGENSSKWVSNNRRALARIFSAPMDLMDLQSPPAAAPPFHPAAPPGMRDGMEGVVSLHDHLHHPPSSSSSSAASTVSSLSSFSSTSSWGGSQSPMLYHPQQLAVTAEPKPKKGSKKPSSSPQPQSQTAPQQLLLPVPQFTAAQGSVVYPPFSSSSRSSSFHEKTLSRTDSNSSLSSLSSISSMASANSIASTSSRGEDSRRLHVELEQSRRKNIIDGLEELKNNLPSCEGQKLSKAQILTKSIAYVQQSKRQKEFLLAQIQTLRFQLSLFRSTCTCPENAEVHINFTPEIPGTPLPFPATPVSYPSTPAPFAPTPGMTPIQPKQEPPSTPGPSVADHRTLSHPAFTGSAPTASFSSSGQRHRVSPTPGSKPAPARSFSAGSSAPQFFPPDLSRVSPSHPQPQSFPSQRNTFEGPHGAHSNPLPPDWEVIMTPDGKQFYVNKTLGLNSWVDPRTNVALQHALKAPPASAAPTLTFSSVPVTRSPPSPEPVSDWTSFIAEGLVPDLSGMNVEPSYHDTLERPPDEGRNFR